MKRRVICLLALALLLLASTALAAGNVTIAINGKDGFDTYIENMFVSGDKLLMFGGNGMYMWSEESGLMQVVDDADYVSAYDVSIQEVDGGRIETIGDEEIELEEDESFGFDVNHYVIGGKIYRTANIYGEDGVETTYLVENVIHDDGTVSWGEVIDLGDALTTNYGSGSYVAQTLASPCDIDGVLYGCINGDEGYEILALDVENQEIDHLSLDLGSDFLASMAKFDESHLMMITYDYDAGTGSVGTVSLMLYDIESEEMREIGTLPLIDGDLPSALCYDSERGKLYYTQASSVWRVDVSEDGVGEPEEFGDMPLQVFSDASGVLMGDLYIVSSYEGVVGRDVTVEGMPPEQLVINDSAFLDAINLAYYDFSEEHSEYSVVKQNGFLDSDDLVQAMMSRSADVDIYVMSASTTAFNTLMSRGYIAELGGSEKLTALVNEMYPFLKDAAMRDGELYAVPLEISSSSMGYNRTLLVEKFGYSEDELPTSWEGLFGLIADWSRNSRMEEVPEAMLMEPYCDQRRAKSTLFTRMMEDYCLWLDSDEGNLSRGGEVMLKLCEAFEQIDWTNLGIPEEQDSSGSWSWNTDDQILFENSPVSLDFQNTTYTYVPPLSLLDGGTPQIQTDVTLAFVNPFSTHKEAAIEYLEMAADHLSRETLISMIPAIKDPIESPYYETNIEYYDDRIAQLEESIVKAEEEGDDETIASLTDELENNIQSRDFFIANRRWSISTTDIEKYRNIAQYMIVTRSSVWNSDDLTTQIGQYIDGALDAQQLVRELERSIQMQRQEGM